ncbi:hypothetical protein [Corynebacterium matruchotii]|jgi:hypothetical protein|nr:hypothetical protein [Corynebacterium matruchotii]
MIKMGFQNFEDLQHTIEITADGMRTNEAKNLAQEFSAYPATE